MIRLLWLGMMIGILLTGCIGNPATPQTVSDAPLVALTTTPTPNPTPTMAPTVIPGSSADQQEAVAVIRQFSEAVITGDELVALLVLSPSAQQTVAASNVNVLLGRPERPRHLYVGSVELDRDIALADCTVRYASGERAIRLRLVRLSGEWKIDGRADS